MGTRYGVLLEEFIGHLKVKNYSAQSIEAFSLHLKQYFAYLKENGVIEIKRINKDDIKQYQEHLSQRRPAYTVSTLGLKVRTIKRFFEHLEQTNQVLVNPAEFIKPPKLERGLPRAVLTQAEALLILDQPNLSWMTGLRDRAVLEVFYSTGIRLEELIQLSIYDCDLQGGFLRVNKGKFAKDRVIPLGKHAIRFLKEYLEHIRPQYAKADAAAKPGSNRTLFLNQSGGPLSSQSVEIMVRTYSQKAGIKKRITPHVFRHSFATQLVKNGADIRAVQKMLGHANLSVTHIYTKVAGVEVKQTHGKSHPREKDRSFPEDFSVQLQSIRERHA